MRPELQRVFVNLCRKSVGEYLNLFDFKSDLLKAMYAATDGFFGLYGTWDTPGTGMNFLIHNMCRLPGSDGTWMMVKGGMGTVTSRLADAALKTGARIETGRGVMQLLLEQGVAKGVVFQDGTELSARTIIVNADPFRLRDLVGDQNLSVDYNTLLDSYQKDGSTFKLNLCLKGLPKFTCLPEDCGQYGTTIHLLPDENEVMRMLHSAFADVQAGRLPEFPAIEWYIHTTLDPALKDPEGHYNSALFVQWVPYEVRGTTWEAQERRSATSVICYRFAIALLRAHRS